MRDFRLSRITEPNALEICPVRKWGARIDLACLIAIRLSPALSDPLFVIGSFSDIVRT